MGDSADTVNKMFEGLKALIDTELPEAEFREVTLEEHWIEMSDGVKLYATVARPVSAGPLPAVIIRNPYIVAEGMYDSVVLPALAEHGYAGVYVRVRGCVKSEGEWLPFQNERRDGMDVLEWVAAQDWCDGSIGTYGASYCAQTQLCIADCGNPALKTMFVSVYGSYAYDVYYRRGMFRQDSKTVWAMQMMGDNRFTPSFPKSLNYKAYAVSPASDLGKVFIGEDCAWYDDWVKNTRQTDEYWHSGVWKEMEDALENVTIPIFFQGGWFDTMQRSELATFRNLPEKTRSRCRYVIGPWSHSGLAAKDAVDFPDENILGTLQLKAALEWFDFHLRGKDYREPLGTVETYCIGEGRWITWKGDITPDIRKKLYFDAKSADGGELTEEPKDPSKLCYEYDPKHPTASCGGALTGITKREDGFDYCCIVQPKIGTRKGVLSFVTEPLTCDMRLAGSVKADLYVSSTAPATSFTVGLMEMTDDGRSINITDDITDIRWRDENRIEDYTPGEVAALHLELTDCVWTLKKGSRLRIDIASSSFPAYHAHPNTVEPWAYATESVCATQTLYCGKTHPSAVELPLMIKKQGGNEK